MMRLRKRTPELYVPNPARERLAVVRRALITDMAPADLEEHERAIYDRKERDYLKSVSQLFNTTRFAGMAVLTYHNQDGYLNPGYEQGTQTRMTILGNVGPEVVEYRHYTGDLLPDWNLPTHELHLAADAMQAILDLRSEGQGVQI